MANNSIYPRELTSLERELLLWLLPEERQGYRQYRAFVNNWRVVAQGRRGEGNYILAPPEVQPDVESPLPQVLAYGVVETSRDSIAVTLRERIGDQIEYEIVGLHTSEPVSVEGERRRWSFSRWSPGMPCVICGLPVRQVRMETDQHHELTLALCSRDARMWVYDALSQINHIIPPTVFYNELMLHKNIRDPKIALNSQRLFSSTSTFSDADFIQAFRTYNQIRMKVPLRGAMKIPPPPRRSLLQRLATLFQRAS